MYEEIIIDGKKLKIRKEIPIEETGIVIKKDKLEDTIDLKEELGEMLNGSE